MLAYLVCFGVRFSLYLASWLSDFDLCFSMCVVFGPLVFPPENGTLAPPPLDPRLGQGGGCPPCPDVKKNGIL